MAIELFLFDHFRLVTPAKEYTRFSSSRAEHLIAYLAIHSGAAVKRQFLAFQLWPESTEAQALSNLRKVIYTLRHELPEISAFLSIDYDTIQIVPSIYLDIKAFRSLIEAAQTAARNCDTATAIQSLAQAIQVYRGDLLPDCYDEWAVVERELLAQEYQHALTRLAELYETQSQYKEAIFVLNLLLVRDPLQEQVYQKLMVLHIQLNDRVAALHTYHACVTVLQRELGISPSKETQALYSELLSQNSASDQPDQDRFHQFEVGRQSELETLKQAWRQVKQTERVKLVVITGEAGIGKTHLAETLVNWVRRQGAQVCSSRCYPAEGSLSFSPLIEWMRSRNLEYLDRQSRREIGCLLPELLGEESPPISRPDEKEHRRLLFDAILRALNQPALVQLFFLDDLQYCDPDTLAWLHYFLRRGEQSHILILATCRAEEISHEHPLTSMLASLRSLGNVLVEVALKPFTPAETFSLAAQLSPQPLPESFLQELFKNSEGNPLFITEFVRSHDIQGPETPGQAREIPLKVKLVIDTRLGQLSPLALKLAGAAAVIGRDFDLSLLQKVSELAEESFLDGMDELWGHGFIHQERGSRYAFNHNLMRDGAYLAQNPIRRQRLHVKVATALEGPSPHQPGPLDVLAAGHYEAGNHLDFARLAYLRAAIYAQSISSINEAIRLVRKAADLNVRQDGERIDRQDEQHIRELLGELLLIDGQHDAARQAFLAALKAADENDDLARSRLLERSAAISPIVYRYDEADSALAKAESLVSRGLHYLDKARMQIWIQIQLDRMWGNFVINRPDAMNSLAQNLRQPLEENGTPVQKGQFLENLVVLELRRNRYVLWTPEARSYALSAVDLYQQNHYPNQIPFALFQAGFCSMWSGWRGDYAQAESDMSDALRVAERVGDKLVRARCLSYLLTLYRKYHQQDQFERMIEPAQAAAWEMRHMGEFTGVVNANLAWKAWTKGDYQGTAAYLQSALKIVTGFTFQQPFFPFYWIGFFPGMDLALHQGELATAAGYIHKMLDPGQQLLYPDMTELLEKAEVAWQDGDEGRFCQLVETVVDLAKEWGYL